MTDPIADPRFNEYTYRAPNQTTISELTAIADQYHAAKDVARDLKAEMDGRMVAAKDAGHSWSQLRDATGLAVATLQAIYEKAHS